MTELDYLRRWVSRDGPVRTDFSDRGMTPDALVDRAREYIRDQRRRKQADRDFDEIWCIFDTDEHKNLPHALNDAIQSRINVAVSNPCFELWLVLHVREQTRHIDRKEVQDLSEELGLTDGKSIPTTAWNTVVEAFEDAKRRARALDERHSGNDSPPRSNPSTDVWRLVDRLRNGP